MESLIWPIVFFFLMFLLLVGVLLYLNRQAQRNLEQARQMSELPFSEALKSVTTALERMSRESRDSLSATTHDLLEMTMQEQGRSQMATMQLMEASSQGSTSAISQHLATTTSLLNDTVKLLGTKDPIAYQMAGGAAVMYEPQGAQVAPYVAADEYAQRQALEDQVRAEAAVEALLSRAVPDTGSMGANVFTQPGVPAFSGFQPADTDHGPFAGFGAGSASD